MTPGHSQICKDNLDGKQRMLSLGGAQEELYFPVEGPLSPEGLRNTSRSLQDGSREVI